MNETKKMRCVDCGGELIAGLKLFETHVLEDGVERIDRRCEHCAEEYARMLWPEETFGPYPIKTSGHNPGNA